MNPPLLVEQERRHLARLIEAVQRCIYFLDAADKTVEWPIDPIFLESHKKDTALFGALATCNERFAKLQDTLGAAMRHALGLLGEPADTFLATLAFYEKVGVIDSIDDWQTCRAVRNLAAHAYETDYAAIAEHFNTLHELNRLLYRAAGNFVDYCDKTLGVSPLNPDFTSEFASITRAATPSS